MRKNHTHIVVVLDRSGSMQSIARETIGGFNSFLKDQKEAPGTATITLYQFDDEFEMVINNQDVQSAADLNSSTFVPRGLTALFDAIGRAINETGAILSSNPAEHVNFVIITDGHENASKEFSCEKIKEMITHQKEKYSWHFNFLGANQDAVLTGKSIGVDLSNAMTYAANSDGATHAFNSTSRNLVSLRSGATTCMAYTDFDRQVQKDAGAQF